VTSGPSGATAFVYIGELCRYLLNQPPGPHDRDHRVRVVIGNGLRPEIWDAFQQRFGIAHICEFYGSSEGNLVFINAFGLPRTAGFTPLPYAILAFDTANERPVRDAHGFMRRVEVGETGLLITGVDAGHPFDGYTDAEATEAKLLHDVFKKGDVWINSGDLVRSQGLRHIAFVDRVGDTFRWKGENVATTEVERAIGADKGRGAGQRVRRCCRAQRTAAPAWRRSGAASRRGRSTAGPWRRTCAARSRSMRCRFLFASSRPRRPLAPSSCARSSSSSRVSTRRSSMSRCLSCWIGTTATSP
jgi:acyl-CoA synthetase (AMP-forming)/AMP-acid ligase II